MIKTKLFTLILISSLVGCGEEDEPKGTVDSVRSILMLSTWTITHFWDSQSGHEESGHYTGFSFSFSDSGNLTATNGTTTHTGSWSIEDSNSQSNRLSDLHLVIFFSGPFDYEALNEEWSIMEITNSKINLKYSYGSSGNDFLTFEKN